MQVNIVARDLNVTVGSLEIASEIFSRGLKALDVFFLTVLCKTDLIFFNKSVPRPGYMITLPELLTGKYFSKFQSCPKVAFIIKLWHHGCGFLQRRRSYGADEMVQL